MFFNLSHVNYESWFDFLPNQVLEIEQQWQEAQTTYRSYYENFLPGALDDGAVQDLQKEVSGLSLTKVGDFFIGEEPSEARSAVREATADSTMEWFSGSPDKQPATKAENRDSSISPRLNN